MENWYEFELIAARSVQKVEIILTLYYIELESLDFMTNKELLTVFCFVFLFVCLSK